MQNILSVYKATFQMQFEWEEMMAMSRPVDGTGMVNRQGFTGPLKGLFKGHRNLERRQGLRAVRRDWGEKIKES
jgi:hypothetical protein